MMDAIDKYFFIEDNYFGVSHYDDLDIILALLDDDDEIVRIEMIEACFACKQTVIHEKLFQMLEIARGLEKGNILLTLSYIFQDDKGRVIDHLKKYMTSSDIYEKMDSYAGLIIIGEDGYLKDFLDFFRSKDYAIRCATANMLAEFIQNSIIAKADIEMIKKTAMFIQEKETTRAVKSSIQQLLEVINNEA